MIAGGHKEFFQVSHEIGYNVLIKQTRESEMNFYEKIFKSVEDDPMHQQNMSLKNFMPIYYGIGLFTTKENKTYSCSIKIENLLHNRPNASVLDMRIGQTSVSCDTPKESIERYNEKDLKTTLVKLGMRVSGYIIRD